MHQNSFFCTALWGESHHCSICQHPTMGLPLVNSKGHPSGEAGEVHVDIMTCVSANSLGDTWQLSTRLSYGATRDVSHGHHLIHSCRVLCGAEIL